MIYLSSVSSISHLWLTFLLTLSGLKDLDLSLSKVDIVSSSSRVPGTLVSTDILSMFSQLLPTFPTSEEFAPTWVTGLLSFVGVTPLAVVEDVPGVWFSFEEEVTSWSLALMFSDRSGWFLGGSGGGIDDDTGISKNKSKESWKITLIMIISMTITIVLIIYMTIILVLIISMTIIYNYFYDNISNKPLFGMKYQS